MTLRWFARFHEFEEQNIRKFELREGRGTRDDQSRTSQSGVPGRPLEHALTGRLSCGYVSLPRKRALLLCWDHITLQWIRKCMQFSGGRCCGPRQPAFMAYRCSALPTKGLCVAALLCRRCCRNSLLFEPLQWLQERLARRGTNRIEEDVLAAPSARLRGHSIAMCLVLLILFRSTTEFYEACRVTTVRARRNMVGRPKPAAEPQLLGTTSCQVSPPPQRLLRLGTACDVEVLATGGRRPL